MSTDGDERIDELLAWCVSELGPVEPVSEHGKSHPGKPVVAHRLRLGSDYCYLKTHRHLSYWEAEVHGYENWAPAFGCFTPRLLAVREEEPRALVVSALAGQCLENLKLPPAAERAVWREAGRALVHLHDLGVGKYFGPCNRDGSPKDGAISDAPEFMAGQLEQSLARSRQMGYLSTTEQEVVRASLALLPAFEGERPIPCHRDYCPVNWIVGDDGNWSGVIDFEFSEWNVRASDFTRYPEWNWIDRPDLVAAFFEGYGELTPKQERQRLVAYVEYALGAVVWGEDNDYHGFAEEGRTALKHLKGLLL